MKSKTIKAIVRMIRNNNKIKMTAARRRDRKNLKMMMEIASKKKSPVISE